jgi:hypothetical protein
VAVGAYSKSCDGPLWSFRSMLLQAAPAVVKRLPQLWLRSLAVRILALSEPAVGERRGRAQLECWATVWQHVCEVACVGHHVLWLVRS